MGKNLLWVITPRSALILFLKTHISNYLSLNLPCKNSSLCGSYNDKRDNSFEHVKHNCMKTFKHILVNENNENPSLLH